MIPFSEALGEVLAQVSALESEDVALGSALGRFLARDVTALSAMPRFDNSSVDGFGVRVSDLEGASSEHPVRLPVAGTVPAGGLWNGSLPQRTALKLMTGAPVPSEVEAVVMREDVDEMSAAAAFHGPAGHGQNIRRRGGEYGVGALLLREGTKLTPPAVAVLASQGLVRVSVHGRPRVRLVVTGSELALRGGGPAAGQIYDSNGWGLEAAVRCLGIGDVRVATCLDDPGEIRSALAAAIEEGDVVITSGGVSVGDFDFVPSAFESLGGRRRFWRVAIKPGKPNYFGEWEGASGRRTFLFGLPGNPVGALLSFERLVRPALLKLMGARELRPAALQARLTQAIHKAEGRLEFVRGILANTAEGAEVEPIAARESHMLVGLASANCLIAFPRDATRLEAGSLVDVELLAW